MTFVPRKEWMLVLKQLMNLGSSLESWILLRVNDASMRWSTGQPATITADKNNGGQARHKDGGQALDLLTIALKTDCNKPMHLGIL